MKNLTRAVLRHKRLVAISWILLTLVGMVAAGPASEALDQRFSVPDREGWETSQEILQKYGNGGETLPLIPVVALPEGKTARQPAVRAQLEQLERDSGKAVEGSRVAGFGSTGDATFISEDGRTAFVYVFPPRSDDPFAGSVDAARALTKAVGGAEIAGATVRVTGYDALYDSSGEADEGPGILLEALIGGFGALIVQFLVALIGLGISIDYALIIVVRWREERERGLDNEDAVTAAMATAGRAVVFSGTTVAVGLLALIALPLPFLRSMGYGGMLIPL